MTDTDDLIERMRMVLSDVTQPAWHPRWGEVEMLLARIAELDKDLADTTAALDAEIDTTDNLEARITSGEHTNKVGPYASGLTGVFEAAGIERGSDGLWWSSGASFYTYCEHPVNGQMRRRLDARSEPECRWAAGALDAFEARIAELERQLDQAVGLEEANTMAERALARVVNRYRSEMTVDELSALVYPFEIGLLHERFPDD